MSRTPTMLQCLYMNARSIKTVNSAHNKLVDLQNTVAENKINLVALTETWLDDSVGDSEILSNFSIHRKDRAETSPGTRGGGILLAVDDSLHSRRRVDLEHGRCEIMVCELRMHLSPKIAVVLCYKPPSSDGLVFNRALDDTLFHVALEFTTIVMLGDFNMPAITWSGHLPLSNAVLSDFYNLTLSYNFDQLNSIMSNDANHILDLIFTNVCGFVTRVERLDCDFPTDHTVLTFNLCFNSPTKPPSMRRVYNYKQGNFNALNQELMDVSLIDVVANCFTPDEMWSSWKSIVTACIDNHVPKVTLKSSRNPPWFDGQVRHAINRKNTAWRKAKVSNAPADWQRYRVLRNECISLLRVKHNAFIARLGDECKVNPKRFWSFFKMKSKSPAIPNTISFENTECTAPNEKCTMFNNYFSSVFTPPSNDDLPHLPLCDVVIPDPSFTVDQVSQVLKNLDLKCACPPNDISPHILKTCHDLLAPSLTILFNSSILITTVPLEWKNAYIVPIFKKGVKQDVKNYRPISLLCTVSKVMERCVFNHLFPFVTPYLYPLQHGFIKGRSCTSQLLKVYHQIGSTLDNGGQVDVIFLDFTKAFDCVSHQLLIHKINHLFGVNNNLLLWLHDYLSGRTQQVIIEGFNSDKTPVVSGVPQGSILGPLLFLLYINDMPSVVQHSTIALFADDSKCFKSIDSVNDCILLQNDIDALFHWSQTWKMSFNASKCKVLSITRSRSPITFSYTMNGTPLENVGVFKDLGVFVDFKLSFNNHVDSLVTKCSKVSGFIKRSVGYHAPVAVKLQLYKSLVLTLLDFTSPVWSPHFMKQIKSLESVQRAMSKYILSNWDISYVERCQDLKLLPLSFKREVNDLLFLFKILNNAIDVDFAEEVQLSEPSNRRSANNGPTLCSHFTRTETFKASYFNRVAHLWNCLPAHIREASSLDVFKSSLILFYSSKLTNFNVDNSCTWISTCRCTGFYH